MPTKFDPVVKQIPARPGCPEIYFRHAGDGFLEVVYGNSAPSANKSLKDIILASLRVNIMGGIIKKTHIPGLIETVPGGEALLYVFDPLTISLEKLVETVAKLEEKLESVEDAVLETRLIRLPLAFEHDLVAKAIEKYRREINPDAFYCKDNSNLEYVAAYNGITLKELKEKFVKTEWFVGMVGFFPGLPYYYPLDPTCAITCPKYNPARTWTAEGTVDLADYCSTIFGVESSGGYQLIGRTAPIFQATQIHPAYKECPCLFKPTDILQYYEATQEEVDATYEAVANGTYQYDIKPYRFVLKDWLEFYNGLAEETAAFRKQQDIGRNSVQKI